MKGINFFNGTRYYFYNDIMNDIMNDIINDTS
jgi:hypothetical protein